MEQIGYKNLNGLKSSASEIDAVANVVNPLLAPIHKLLRESANGISDVVIIRTGDSTRSTIQSEWQIYDPIFFNQLGLTYYNNAAPSQTALGWMNNTAINKLSEAIANSKGVDGENTILEFSMGLNDYTFYGNTTAGKAQTKDAIKNAIQAYQIAKPKAIVYLVSPNNAGNDGRRNTLRDIYSELAIELNLFLVDGLAVTSMLDYNSTDYYIDTTHMNQYGMLRQQMYILNKICPLDLIKNIKFGEYVLPPTNTELAETPLLIGLWSVATGAFSSNSNYRALKKIPVVPNFRLNVTHKGNRTDFIWYDINGNFLFKGFPSGLTNGVAYIPYNAYFLAVNISTEGATYDALNDTPTLKYHFNAKHITHKELVNGYNSNITYLTKDNNGITYDSYGKTGAIGEFLKIDSNNKMKWSS
jgi:hypothetical protein